MSALTPIMEDTNVICPGGMVVGHDMAWELVQTFLAARFTPAARHRRRLEKVERIEAKAGRTSRNSAMPVEKANWIFIDIGGVLLTNGWGHLARRRAVKEFNLDWAEMEIRHRLTFEIHEQGKLSFDEYLDQIVFYKKRPFSRAQFRTFMCAQSKPFPEMIKLISELKVRHG